MNDTLNYYNAHADQFISGTVSVDMGDIYNRFLKYVRPHSKILDLGCGSGRDSKYFLDQGHLVQPIDGSEIICQNARKFLNTNVLCMTFDELNFKNEFDAVWACASLLHVEKKNMKNVLQHVSLALKSEGILYVSYKYGHEERIADGRYFSDYTEKDIPLIFTPDVGLNCTEWWISTDVRADRDQKWLNIICRKNHCLT